MKLTKRTVVKAKLKNRKDSEVKLLLNNDMNICLVQNGPEKDAKYSVKLEFTDGEEISTYPLSHENLLSFMSSAAGENFFDINSNRSALHDELTELQADLEDLSNEALIENRACMLEHINMCMTAIGETDEDNL